MTIFYGGRDLDTDADPTWEGWTLEAIKLALVIFNIGVWALILWVLS